MYACLFALQFEEWQILAELGDATWFASWSKNKEGWDTLEEHRDPSRCAGVTVESGKITQIDLADSNLVGGGSSHLFNHMPRTTSATSDVRCVCSAARVHWQLAEPDVSQCAA
jgi:hypothetical protein